MIHKVGRHEDDSHRYRCDGYLEREWCRIQFRQSPTPALAQPAKPTSPTSDPVMMESGQQERHREIMRYDEDVRYGSSHDQLSAHNCRLSPIVTVP